VMANVTQTQRERSFEKEDEFILLPIAPPVEKLRSIELKDGDIFIASWPKSGTTWTQAIIAHLIASDRSTWNHASEITPFFDVQSSWQEIDNRLEPAANIQNFFQKRGRRAWNTHMLWSLIPKSSVAKYIYLIRDQRDAVLSFWYHLRNQRGAGGDYQGTADEFAIEASRGKLPYSSWARHVADWSKAISDERVLFIRYENLKSDLSGCIHKIANHIGVTTVDPNIVAKYTSFEAMRADCSRYEPISVNWESGFQFFRRGRTGDGATAFSSTGNEALQADATKYLSQLPESTRLDLDV